MGRLNIMLTTIWWSTYIIYFLENIVLFYSKMLDILRCKFDLSYMPISRILLNVTSNKLQIITLIRIYKQYNNSLDYSPYMWPTFFLREENHTVLLLVISSELKFEFLFEMVSVETDFITAIVITNAKYCCDC